MNTWRASEESLTSERPERGARQTPGRTCSEGASLKAPSGRPCNFWRSMPSRLHARPGMHGGLKWGRTSTRVSDP
eukprot:2059474-Alexandrium_andersonii.AAC.1